MVYKDAEIKHDKKLNRLLSLYEEKNDTIFVYMLEHTVPTILLADTLESLSKTEEDESPAKVQQFIETAKTQAREIDEQLFLLMQLSGYNNDIIEKYVNTGETDIKSDEPDLSFLAYSMTWNPMYTISYQYWKSNPKLIDDRTREFLLSLAGELRLMDKTLSEVKEWEASISTSPNYPGNIKAYLVEKLQPYLINIEKLNEDFYSDLRSVG